ncbi:3-keto-steroid reductase [Sporothrix curviconia]|uniref:3-keto-steroid reductase n=1 Tax=Sporothrix curviconia TaxID=1260050 RepID=A0ABP0ARM3_9PEZI
MPAAPWDNGAAAKQLFVLVTGANSGIGLGIGQRLIDEFAAAHPSPYDHLVVITTTRSATKSRQTTDSLRRYLGRQEDSAAAAKSSLRPGRIHLASIELDLCNLPSVCAAADRLRTSPLSIYTGTGKAASSPHTIPRLDSVIFNAGIGGWTGIGWWNLLTDVLFNGIPQATTFPTCKAATGGLLVDPLTGKEVKGAGVGAVEKDGVLGQVFCANIFGHYVFAHALLPLLRGTSGDSDSNSSKTRGRSALGPGPARIIWESSVEAEGWKNLSLDDFQAIHTVAAYESSKRLTDVLALTANLKGVAPVSAPFYKADTDDSEDHSGSKSDSKSDEDGTITTPATYVTHPGVVCSTLFPLNWFYFMLYNLAMYISRWLGSPWHPITAYKGAAAAVWVALQPKSALDALDAQHVKWGTGTTRGGTALVKRSEVEGWGFRGLVGEELGAATTVDSTTGKAWSDGKGDPLAALFPYPAYLLNSRGRKKGAATLTAERRHEFEVLGRDCWREMERLRKEWAERVRKAREDSSQA